MVINKNMPTKNITTGVERTDEQERESFKKELSSLREEINLLKNIADKKKLALYYQKEGKRGPAELDVRTLRIEGKEKVVIGWRMILNEVDWDPVTRRWEERQSIEVLFDDGTKKEMSYRDFELGYKRVKCHKIGEETFEHSAYPIFVVRRIDTGEEYRISAQFVN